MTGITSLTRDWGTKPAIVRMTTTNDLAAITTAGYIAAQATNIALINAGAFEWDPVSDYVLVNYDAGTLYGFFVYDAATESLTAAAVVPGSLADTLVDGHIFVGSALNVATGVAMSGDVHIINSGATTIQALAVTTGKLAANAVTSAKLALNTIQYAAIPITAAQFKAAYGAPFVLVAAGGANTLHVVDQAVLEMTFVSAQYTAGGATLIQYDSTVHGAGIAASTTLAAATINADAASACNMMQGALADGALASIANKALYLSNSTAAFATGDSTFILHLWYHTVATV